MTPPRPTKVTRPSPGRLKSIALCAPSTLLIVAGAGVGGRLMEDTSLTRKPIVRRQSIQLVVAVVATIALAGCYVGVPRTRWRRPQSADPRHRRGVRRRITVLELTADHRPRPRPLAHRRQPAARAGTDRCSARHAGRGTDHRRRGTAELRGSADCGRRHRLRVRGTPT